jgi:Ras-related C3 botulinum toxin substrate 1
MFTIFFRVDVVVLEANVNLSSVKQITFTLTIMTTQGVKHIKLVIVGDGAVGKTCLLSVYSSNSFPIEYVPTILDNSSENIMVDGRIINLSLWDTAAQDEYDQRRHLSYPGTSVFIVCFSVDSPSSLENVKNKWHPEVKHYCPNTPLILVGTKADLRKDGTYAKQLKDTGVSMISETQGEELRETIKAVQYVECSAKTNDHVKQVFDEAICVALFTTPKPPKEKKCSIL